MSGTPGWKNMACLSLTRVLPLLFVFLCGLLSTDAAALTATGSPSNCTNNTSIGTINWTSPTSAYASDNAYAQATLDGEISRYLYCTGYGFAIPAGAIIQGITVNVERKSNRTSNGGSNDAAVRLIKGGVIGTADRATATSYTTSDVIEAHGSAADLWGTTWTIADINAANFGVAFAATKADPAGQPHVVTVDHIEVVVTYSTGTTTLATGSDPAAATIAPGTAATDVDLFTLQTSSGTEAITSVTVNLSTSSGVGRLAITDNAGMELGFTATPVTGANTIAVAGMSATTTLTTFKVRITPLSHAAMPAVPGAEYAITAPATAWAGPNTHAGSDTNPNALTIDNLSPAGATVTSGSAGNAKTTLNWTTSSSADFALTDGSVVYRWAAASAGTEVPVEGSTPVLGSANGTATVVCLVSSAISTPLTRIDGAGGSADCTTVALTIGQPYTYKIFQKDANGNYDVGVTIGTFTSSFPAVVSINLASPDPTSPATLVDWTVTFNESVTGVDATDFALVEAGGATGASITGVSGGGTTWTVTANSGTGAGTLGLNLVDNDTIVNTILVPLGGAGAGNGNFTGQAYTVEYTASGFVFTDSACVHNIAFGAPGQTCAQVSWSTPPQVAGQDLTGAYITAVNTSGVPTRLHTSQDRTRDMQFGLSCHDPVANAGIQATFAGVTLPLCQTNGATPVVWSAVVTVTFPGGSPSSSVSYTFNYADVGLVALWARNNATPSETGTSGAFVVKPAGFVLSNIIRTSDSFANPASVNATGTKFVKAGETFSVTVTATTAGGVATPNYGQENTAESVKLTPTLVVGLGLTNNPEVSGTFGTFSSGVATGTTFTWNEAGIVTLTPSVADADYLGTGDVTGTASGNVGRFYAAQFTLSGGVIANRTGLAGCAAPAGCGTFTYMGEEMSAVFSLIAKAADGTTTLQNYNYSATAANNFAKFDPIATGNPLVLAAVDTGTPRTVATLDTTTYGVASGNFSGGIATVTAPFAVIRGGSPSGPFDALDVGINPVDSDGATLAVLDLAVNVGGAPDTHGKISSTKARYGRIKISNAHGSELLNLPVSVVAQYWNGTTYITNTLDDDSTFAATDVALNNYQKNLASGETSVVTPPALVVFTAGIAGYKLAAPGSGNNGSVDMTVNVLSAYLSSNTARATFGVYKGNNEFIYLRENY